MLELIETKNTDELIFFITVRIGIILACWIFVILSNIIDFWSGVTTAKVLGETIKSRGFRKTIIKIDDYVKIMLFALMFDALGSLFSFYVIPFVTILCTVAIIIIESKSVIENSKRKKTHVADVPKIVNKIVQATTIKQGKEVLNDINELLNINKKRK